MPAPSHLYSSIVLSIAHTAFNTDLTILALANEKDFTFPTIEFTGTLYKLSVVCISAVPLLQ